MSDLDQVISISITRNTTTPTQVGFGTPMLVGTHSNPDRVKAYDSLSGLAADFAATDPIYLMAQDLLSQNPSTPLFKVGRRDLPPTQGYEFTPVNPVVGKVYTISVAGPGDAVSLAGVDFSYTCAVATVADVVTGLQAALALGTGDFTATDDVTSLGFDADNAGELFGISGVNEDLLVQDTTADPGIGTDLTAIQNADSDWYGLLIDSNSKAEVAATAVWTEAAATTAVHMFVAQTMDSDVLATYDAGVTTDLGSVLKDNGYDRTLAFFNKDSFDFIAAAFLGKMLPTDPGSSTGAYKTLASIGVDSFAADERLFIEAKSLNYYTALSGVNITRWGTCSSGEYFDVIRGTDHLSARIQERVFTVFVNSPKVPFTDAGIAAVQGEILAQLGASVASGFLADDPQYTCTVPLAADVSAADKGARRLTGVVFRATLAGAVHYVTIQGELNL